ncbi:hypothetical protein F4776DRAFT_607879 [Hypoxylon sp. NC0597]|nr:hypothetical protein F4776DRAFT_607879 [Hypoxylon sp. NC0597]
MDEGPLAIQLLKRPESIDRQALCPFSKLPIELREQIWRLSLRRFEDLNKLYKIDNFFARPGQAAPFRIAVELLLTCRAIYVETFLTPFLVNSLEFYDGDPIDPSRSALLTQTLWDDGLERSLWNLRATLLPSDNLDLVLSDSLKMWQFANISSVDITVRQSHLENRTLEEVAQKVGTIGRHEGHGLVSCGIPGGALFLKPEDTGNEGGLVCRKITHLTLRINHTDWRAWKWRPYEYQENACKRLQLEPLIKRTSERERLEENTLPMTRGYEARKAGHEPDFGEKQGGWGLQIGEHWPDLTTLELVLETFACKKEQLDYVVQCAKLWTFPSEDGFHLCWNGKEDAVRWRGAESYSHYEMEPPWSNFRSWYKMENTFRRTEAQDSTLIKWRPTTEDDAADEAQEFVIHTLIFEKRRNTYWWSD